MSIYEWMKAEDAAFEAKAIKQTASLIAAAPDLLKALEALLAEHEKYCAHGALPSADDARAAIRKAKGEL